MAGEVVHVEFPAQDADRAQQFWGGLFGWQFQDSGMPGMDYRMARAGETMGAAIFPSEERSGFPNYYFKTDEVRDLGGDAEDKSPVPGHGWFAACHDSEGNAFHLWQDDSAAG
jgi:hypothetical protein